jgi:general secretion pathway protein J
MSVLSSAPRPLRRAGERGGSAGFTLLEMVLALVIFGMIAALVYSAFFFGHRAVTSGERAADDNQRMRLVEELMGRQVRSAVYYFARHDDDQIPFFLGASDGMSFVTSAPQSNGGTGLAVVTYRMTQGRLVLEERTNFTPDELYDPPADARVERAVLLEGISSLRLMFLPYEEQDLGWVDKWDPREDEDSLPAVVRVTIDGLPFFPGQAWVREIPLLTMAAGWGDSDFQEPPEEPTDEEDDTDDTDTDTSGNDDADTGDGDSQ